MPINERTKQQAMYQSICTFHQPTTDKQPFMKHKNQANNYKSISKYIKQPTKQSVSIKSSSQHQNIKPEFIHHIPLIITQ
jgi:hypothetical protein